MKTIYHDFTEDLYAFHRTSDGFNPHYLHFHRYYEFSIVTSGDLDIISDGAKLHENRPVIIFHAPYSFHEIIASPGTVYDYYVFHCSRALYDRICSTMCSPQALFRAPLTVIPIEGDFAAELMPLLGSFSDEPDRKNLRSLLMACILEIASRYRGMRVYPPVTEEHDCKPRHGTDYIYEIAKYINENYQEPLTSESLAATFYISRQKLDADFKDVMDSTLRQFIIDTRIANAVRMLTMGESITAVTFDCGFVNESHFIRTFRQRIGITPGQFQKNGGGTMVDGDE